MKGSLFMHRIAFSSFLIFLAACSVEDLDGGTSSTSSTSVEAVSSESDASSSSPESCDGISCSMPDVDIDANIEPQASGFWCSDQLGYTCKICGNDGCCGTCPGIDCQCDDCYEQTCRPNEPAVFSQSASACAAQVDRIRCTGCSNGGTMTHGGCIPLVVGGITIPSTPSGCEIYGGPQPLHWKKYKIPCSAGCCT